MRDWTWVVRARVGLRIAGMVAALLLATPSISLADSLCSDWDARTVKFMDSILPNIGKMAPGGQFQVKAIDVGGKSRYDTTYVVGGAQKFHLDIAPSTLKTGEVFSVAPFHTPDGGALLSQVSLGGSDGAACGYLIHRLGNKFHSVKLEGVFQLLEPDGTGIDAVAIYTRLDWSDQCGVNVSWPRVARLETSTGKLVDSSSEHRAFYDALAKKYKDDKATYSAANTPSTKECVSQFDGLIAKAEQSARGKDNPRNAGKGDGSQKTASGGDRKLAIGQSDSGVSYRKVGPKGVIYLGNNPVVACVEPAQGRPPAESLALLQASSAYLTRISPSGRHAAVFCVDEDRGGYEMRLLDLKAGTYRQPAPREAVALLGKWVDYSPGEKRALMNQTGDQGDYSPIAIDLETGRVVVLKAPLFPDGDAGQIAWTGDNVVRYEAAGCDEGPDCMSMGVYAVEADFSTNSVRKKRLRDAPRN